MQRFLLLILLSVTLVTASQAQFFADSNLPILIINTNNSQPIVDDPKILAELKIIDNNGTGLPGAKRNALTDRPALTSTIGIELRGSSSQMFPKKPYGFEVRESNGQEAKSVSILGLPSEPDWVLNATYNDKTLLRETLTYDIYQRISPYYSSRFRYCELVLNGQYQGLYIVLERVKRDKNRVPISSIKKSDVSGDALTGGYLLKIDKTTGAPSRMWTSPFKANTSNRDIPIQIERPKPEDLADEQFRYIRNYVTEFETALAGPKYSDAVEGFRKYAEEASFVDYMLLTEISKNVDGYRLSAFFYKDRDSKGGKLVMGPPWDYNLTYGNADYCDGNSSSGWAKDFNRVCSNDGFQMPFWWDRLLTDKGFAQQVRVKYQTHRQSVLRIERINKWIDSTAAVLSEARQRNFQRWPVIGRYVWPNGYVGPTYEAEIEFLKNWTRQRLTWLDRAVEPLGQDVLAAEPAADWSIGPNPTAGSVTLRYDLNQSTDVAAEWLDAQGRAVGRQTWAQQPAGPFERSVPAPSAPGVYFLKLNANGRAETRKIVKQ